MTLVNSFFLGLVYCTVNENRDPGSPADRFCGEEWEPARGLLFWGLPLLATGLVAFWQLRQSERFPWLAIVAGLVVNLVFFVAVDQLPNE